MLRRCGKSSLSCLRKASSAKSKYAGQRYLATASSALQPKVIFSGIQPTGVPHLGNYLGALKRWTELQTELKPDDNLIFSLVDLHALTVRQDPKQLKQWRNESLAMLLAIGLDPNRCTIFHQSAVPAHSELMWILSCQASTGYLARMTQWKDKTANERENSDKTKLGLFSYPVLMSSDILVHGATHVPVGHDQVQHLEFAREVAIGFNSNYAANLLVPPQTMISPAKRIMALTDPTAKMSKSHANPKSRILLTDSEAVIRDKIRAAMTDSSNSATYDPESRPGVSNLLDILFHADGAKQYADQHEIARDLQGLGIGAVKERVVNAVEAMLRPIRERFLEIESNQKLLDDVASEGAEKARRNAARTITTVKAAIGLD